MLMNSTHTNENNQGHTPLGSWNLFGGLAMAGKTFMERKAADCN